MARTNHAARRQLLYDPYGPVGRDLTRRGRRVQNRAKVILTATGAVDHGRLRASIEVTDPRPHPRGQALSVGSNLIYSIPIHDGSGAANASRSWKTGRRVRPRRYLTGALPAARS